ncbi:hypothetical protein TW95_gp0622 [Pandoravirus inopinatum]|uniref:Uncharacterized protein n=1 Tax=Pandoravirus inopinatum TaxID=1605721 RepID=A0A0B5J955_9VIRU|nr:hypothetical protein TW95_gp0622 [Pandoravirus inopinatum]AJF97356.1 hypothetical protein [Pandoravirus inopinatum]
MGNDFFGGAANFLPATARAIRMTPPQNWQATLCIVKKKAQPIPIDNGPMHMPLFFATGSTSPGPSVAKKDWVTTPRRKKRTKACRTKKPPASTDRRLLGAFFFFQKKRDATHRQSPPRCNNTRHAEGKAHVLLRASPPQSQRTALVATHG